MIYRNGTTPRIFSLYASEITDGYQQAVMYLSQNYHIAEATSVQSDAMSEIRSADIVIAPINYPDINACFSSLRENLPPPGRPLMILLADTFPENTDTTGADAVLPTQPISYLEMQIRALLNLHTQNKEMLQTNALLITQNRTLNTELSAQQRAVSEINLLKDSIVSTVSHELKTPLLQVKSSVALLAENVGNTDLLVEYAQVAVTRLETVINNIARLAESLNMDSQSLGPVLVKETIDYAIRNLRRSWEHKDHTERIKVIIPESIPPVQAFKQGLAITLQLLLDNALKFSEGIVEISAIRHENGVRFIVKDYGIGIAKDKIDKIFDSFYQVDNSSTRRIGGIGVGLAIVRFIMERHNTHIVVESEEGKGSTFSFVLPIAEIRGK